MALKKSRKVLLFGAEFSSIGIGIP